MPLRCPRPVALAALAVVITLSAALPSAPAAAAPSTPAVVASADGPTLTGTLTNLLAGLLAALLGGQQTVPAPEPSPGTAPQPPMPMTVAADLEDRVVTLVNKRRARAGCRPLRSNERLRTSARTHSVGMAQYRTMTHYLPGEAGLGDRITFAGYRGWRQVAENVATGFPTPRAVMQAWMASAGHRANILDCRLRHLGVGVVVQGDRVWWTQDFARR
ncbi:CAP domain-containing protein [Nocardioides nitrophenolicus]|uniref:CAP domain-containing protein n=1 Tax=Nocardioides nitrophenolicus TaxID=60489 RepID=UPI00195CFBDD|nr:CAP domain-containing protein [Nocardioides nitrophenolicus]MBM7517837.1 uncharacterized protein YkwD [Nocardioides nitrophenolicus]